MVMDENVALIITGVIVAIIGLAFCINATFCPFGILLMIAGGVTSGCGFIKQGSGW